MVVHYDYFTDEIQRARLKIRDELVFSPQRYGDEDFVHIEVPSEGKFFRVSFSEYGFISMLDGNTSLAHALAVSSQNLGTDALSESRADQLTEWLLANNLATMCEDSGSVRSGKSNNGPSQKSLFQKLNPFWMKLPLGSPDRLLKAAWPYFRWCFHPLALLATSVFILFGIGLLFSEYQAISESASNLFTPHNLLATFLAWVVLKIVHEFGHAMTCHHFGGKVKDTGIIFILFAPLAYVDATSSLRFQSRRKRMAVAAAGMFVELAIASACVCAWFLVSSPEWKQQLTHVMIAAGFSTILFNANPLMRFDGYFLLSDILRIPNLYTTGSEAVKRHVRWLFLGQTSDSSIVELRKREVIISAYGYLALCWRVLICVSLTMTASVLFQGFGVLLAVMGMFMWFFPPVSKCYKTLAHTLKTRPHGFFRAATMTFLFISTGLGICLLPNPFVSRAPCLVDYEDGSKIRSGCAGTIEELFVQEGSWVEKGNPILRIANRELESVIRGLQAELASCQTEERIALNQGDAGAAANAREQEIAIQETLEERERELKELLIRAPRSGYVVGSNFDQLTGSYVQKGAHIFSVSTEEAKEIIIAACPDQMNPSSLSVGDRVQIELGTHRRFLATIKRVTPQANTQVSRPRLIATNGGPLAIQKSDDPSDEKMELLKPHFEVVAGLEKPVAQRLYAGERGHTVLRSSASSLGGFAYRQIRDWLNNQFRLAQSGS